MLSGQGLTPTSISSATTTCGWPACRSPRTRPAWSTASKCSRSTARFASARRQAGGSDQIENRSKLELHSVCIVETRPATKLRRHAGSASCCPASRFRSSFDRMSTPSKPPFADERAAEAQRSKRRAARTWNRCSSLALDPKHIEDGETRLVARVDEVLPGETITPAASQVRGATLVVAHLRLRPAAAAAKRRQHPPRHQSRRRTRRRSRSSLNRRASTMSIATRQTKQPATLDHS